MPPRRSAPRRTAPERAPAEPTRYLELASRQYVDTTRPRHPPRAEPGVAAEASAGAPSEVARSSAPGRRHAGPTPIEDSEVRAQGRASHGPPMTRRQFESEWARLLRDGASNGENPGSFSCKACRGCSSCMFCVECSGCYRCTHCVGCQDGSHLTHCQECKNCHGCAYCVRSESCADSSYLVLCRSCCECTYCFGCLGLAKKDFHILNAQYTKTEYFRIVKRLRAEMGI